MQDPTKKITQTQTTTSGDEDVNNDNTQTPENKNHRKKSTRTKKMPKVRRDDRLKLPVDIVTLDNGNYSDLMLDDMQGYEIRFNIFVLPIKPICGKPMPPEEIPDNSEDDTTNDNNDSNFNVPDDVNNTDETNPNINN